MKFTIWLSEEINNIFVVFADFVVKGLPPQMISGFQYYVPGRGGGKRCSKWAHMSWYKPAAKHHSHKEILLSSNDNS